MRLQQTLNQTDVLRQSLERFESRATQMTYSLNRLQYLLVSSFENNESNKEFISGEYKFLQRLMEQISQDLIPFHISSQENQLISEQLPLKQSILKTEENSGKPSDSNESEEMDDEHSELEDKGEELEKCVQSEGDEQTYQKTGQTQFDVIGLKKSIEKDKRSACILSGFGVNHSSSVQESSQSGKESQRQIRRKKYPPQLRNQLIQEIQRKDFSYRHVCKKFGIPYGTAYYLINSIQKELGESFILQNESKLHSGQRAKMLIAPDKQSTSDNGRNKYSDEFKQKIFVESYCGNTYKQISDKYKVSYETCYYLINAMKLTKSKDSNLSKLLNDQIEAYATLHGLSLLDIQNMQEIEQDSSPIQMQLEHEDEDDDDQKERKVEESFKIKMETGKSINKQDRRNLDKGRKQQQAQEITVDKKELVIQQEQKTKESLECQDIQTDLKSTVLTPILEEVQSTIEKETQIANRTRSSEERNKLKNINGIRMSGRIAPKS